MKPRVRKQGLVVTELPNELLVYDLERHKAHCLNPTAALVFKQCDGRKSVEQVARTLGKELDVAADERLVWLSLDRLARANLLEARPTPPLAAERYSRRELVRRVGLAAATLPVVATVLAPSPAEAIVSGCVADCTGQPFGTPCYAVDPDSGCLDCACDGLGNCLASGGSGPGACLL
jgi:hypothetical protein